MIKYVTIPTVKLVLQFFLSLTIICLLCYLIADSAASHPSTWKAVAIWGLVLAWIVANAFNIVTYVKTMKRY
jgi:phosphate starvation-inducible membrane PsiE